MSKIHNQNNLQNSAKKISEELAPYIHGPIGTEQNNEFDEIEDEKTPLLEKSRETIYNPSSLGVPQTNLRELLNPKADTTKPPGFFTRLSNSKVGKGAATVLSWATSKGVVRAVNIAIPAFAFAGFGALSGGMVPLAALVITLGVTAYNIVRDTKALRANRDLEQERKLLQEYHAAKNVENQALALLKSKSGIDISEPAPLPATAASMKSKFKSKYENNLTTRSLRKTILDGLFEASGNAATVAVVATSGLANAAMNALSVGSTSGILTIIDIILTTRARKKLLIVKNAMRKEIDTMREGVPAYKSLEELKTLTQKQKIKTESLRQVVREDVSQLDEASLRQKISIEEQVAASKPEFAMPVKPSFWEKTKQYFKDVHMVHWPNNDYYTPEKFAAKNYINTAIITAKYSVLSKEIQSLQKNVELAKTPSHNREVVSHSWEKNISSEHSASIAGVTSQDKKQVMDR